MGSPGVGKRAAEAITVETEHPAVTSDLTEWTAVRLAAGIAAREVSAREVVQAHLDRIAAVNGQVNAVVTLVAEQAMAEAARADEELARGGRVGPLHGLPVGVKDTRSEEQTPELQHN